MDFTRLLTSADSNGDLTSATGPDAFALVADGLAAAGHPTDPVRLNAAGRAALAEIDPDHPAVRSL